MRQHASPTSLVSCVAMVLELFAGAALAQQPSFTFNVPGRLQQVQHDVEKIRVSCTLMFGEGGPIVISRFIEPAAGDHSVDFVLQDFTSPEDRDLTTYTHWQCRMFFFGPDGVAKIPSPDAQEPWARVRPGAMVDTGLQPLGE